MGVATALAIGATVASSVAQKKAQKKQQRAAEEADRKAREDARKAETQARKAEVFAETEGKGTGTLGQIRSGISTDITEDEDKEIRQGKSRRSSSLQL